MAVFWNYLLHELRQSHSAIPELVRENEKGCLLSVWIFFAREKLFHLKCLHHILIQSANGKKYSVCNQFFFFFKSYYVINLLSSIQTEV